MRVPPGNISGGMTIQLDGLHHHAYAVIADPVNISLDVTAAEAYPNPLNAHPTLQYFFVTCLALQSVFGTIGNILVMGAVYSVPALRMTGNFFIINLALADILVTSVTQPANILGALRGERWFQERPIFCSVIGTLCATGCISSTWNICMISINRYILICHNDCYHRVYTKRRTLLLCLAVWVLIYSIELPNHVGWGDKRFSVVFFVCTFANHVHSYAVFFIGLGVLVPVGASFLAYLGIYCKVRHSALVQRRANRRSMERTLRAEHRAKRRAFRENVRVAQALFRVFLVFILMWLPVAVVILTVLLAHGNSSINCVVYAASIDHFREGYCKLLGINAPVKGRHVAASLSAEGNAVMDLSLDLPMARMGNGKSGGHLQQPLLDDSAETSRQHNEHSISL
ncbi:putative Melatonin receptor type 1B-B [Hypsibius exemplaris]|uniref:Melatonin receptor type 1B-B n=1 Tax=Hypsibius exemplaris TaxID=2072580 RepID=A0A1W0WNQ7_HYPEX|nr:putative Melatonin receptor type 1B-B [Hypsibius exemplaris]